ncbi:MAG: ATP-dependent helicase [Lachnospiraceae bacterium]|nr:ATP-dependent helicase [Lachnospiraceae bacterium]
MKKQFSNSQLTAINHNSGPCLVLAGPGSGKTTVITHRTKVLIEKYNINPSNILVITFTKAAAVEMQERFEKLMNGQKLPVSFGTFHAVFFKILKYAYNYKAENILREELKYNIIKELIDKEDLDLDDEKEFILGIISEISNVKGDMINIDNYYSSNCSDEVFKRIYKGYEKILRRKNLIDFDDMLILCYELFVARKDILSAWQNKYKYILIDEFQDINRVQYEVMKMLALPENNLFIVGDDDQSIYRFRGARPEIMLNFEKEYEGCKRVLLDANYRCTKSIVDASMNLISYNQHRFDKKIISGENVGKPVKFVEFKSPVEENMFVIDIIRNYVNNGGKYSDIAILSRTNIGPRFLVDKLMEHNLPFRMKDAMPNVYEHFIAKDIFAYIRYALGENSRANFLRIINKPNRYISREILRNEVVNIEDLMSFFVDKRWMIERLDKLQFDLRMIKQMKPYAAINYIFQGIEYENYLEEYADFRRMKVEELYEIRDEILESSKQFQNFQEWFEYIEEYGKELENQAKMNNKIENAIEISTMHSSKGLEYEIVFLIDCVEGVVPYSKAVLDEDIEEERRLFYVALTRAKKEVNVFWVKERFNKKVDKSRFINEMRNGKKK